MHWLRRGWLLSVFSPVIATTVIAQDPLAELAADPRVAWLRDRAEPVRSIDPADENFSDLDFLRPLLSGARVVFLGEADHGSGSDFLAKTRLVKFLHRELGFDVLAFESPIYDMTVAWDSLREGTSAQAAFRLGAGTWAGAVQMESLIAYLGEQARGRRPLELAGFDHQHQTASSRYFARDLSAFLAQRGVNGRLTDPESPEYVVLEGLAQVLYQYGVTPLPDSSVVSSFASMVQSATAAVSAMPDGEARQWTQNLKSLGCQIRYVARGWWRGRFGLGDCNRDQQMAENLLWLVHERYPNRKIIVWAATAHTSRAPQLSLFGVPDRFGGNAPSTAKFVADSLGAMSYSIALTSYTGSSRFNQPETRQIRPDHDSSAGFEEIMAAAGFDYGFMDLRNAPPESWLRDAFPARPVGHTTVVAPWRDLVDALLFIREQQPRRNLEPSAADVAAIDTVRRRAERAFTRGDESGYVRSFTEDVLVRPPNQPRLRGRAPLRSWFTAAHDQFTFRSDSTRVLATIVQDDLAWDLYMAWLTIAPRFAGGAVDEHRRGMRVFRRHSDGTWRIVQDTWNVMVPRAP